MSLDVFKTVWKEYDRKLQSTQEISDRIVRSMIAERAVNRFSKVRRQYALSLAWMSACLGLGIVIILTNPFDYTGTLQFIPMGVFVTGIAILIAGLTAKYLALQRITFSHRNIADALSQVIAVYEKPRTFLSYTVIAFLFSQVFLFPLSFLPRSIEARGLWLALGERLIPISIATILVYVAYKLGAFKERHVDHFRKDQNELQDLKAMSAE